MFAGYLLKINNVIFPNKFIAVDTYDTTPNQTQDDNDYIDGDGYLKRSILPHKRSKMEFNTPFILESKMSEFRAFFINTDVLNIQYWNPKKGVYETGVFYTPDINYQIHSTINNDIKYKPIRIAFIEY